MRSGSGEWLASVTYDLAGLLGTDAAHWNIGYLHSESNTQATHLNRFRDGFSTALILTDGPLSFVPELLMGRGGEDGKAAALNFQAGWFVTDHLQLALRYQLADSDRDDGLRAQRRYESNTAMARGESYQAAYVGVNYHLAAHRLKLMAGVEYAVLDDRDLWTALTGVRLFWGPHSRGPFPMAQTLKAW